MKKILMNDNCDDQSTIGDDGKDKILKSGARFTKMGSLLF